MSIPKLNLPNCDPFDVRQGGMAYVYLCRGSGPHEDYIAVKRLKPEYAAQPLVAQYFLRECFFWMTFGFHPNVVQAYSAHRAPIEPPFIILEYVKNSLRDFLNANAGFTWSKTISIISDICHGMAYANSRNEGFIHRDLKPENVLIDNNGVAKVTDFGLATAADVVKSHKKGVHVGTPMYMAPEQIKNEPIPIFTDIYAIGCIMFEMLTGQPVFGMGKSVQEYLDCHKGTLPVDVRKINSDIPKSLALIVQTCLLKNPLERYSSFEILRSELYKASDDGLHKSTSLTLDAKVDTRRMYMACQGLVNLGLGLDAIKVGEELIGLEPNPMTELMTRVLIARVYGEQEKFSESEKRLAEIQTRLDETKQNLSEEVYNAVLVSFFTEKGRTLSGLGKLDSAIEYFQKVTDLNPNVSTGWHNLSVNYRRVGKLDKAIEAEVKALNISTNLAYFLDLSHMMIEYRKDFQGALSVLEEAISYHPHLYLPNMRYAMVAILYIPELLNNSEPNLRLVFQVLQAAKKASVSAEQLGAPKEEVNMIQSTIQNMESLFAAYR